MDMRIRTLHRRVELVIPDAERLAEAFFRHDPSSVHARSYDNWILKNASPSNRIVVDDVHAINTTMAARSKVSEWQMFTANPDDLPALAAIAPTWDLFATPNSEWQTERCLKRVHDLLAAVMGPWRNAAVATKVLHAKRPRLIPVLDSYVVQMLGGSPEPSPQATANLIAHLREQGQANLDALLAIQQHLGALRYPRSLVRIMDALLWLSHPGAWGSPAYRHLASSVTVEVSEHIAVPAS